jgi:hypothetical protein
MTDDEAARKASAIQAYRQKLVQHTEIDGKVSRPRAVERYGIAHSCILREHCGAQQGAKLGTCQCTRHSMGLPIPLHQVTMCSVSTRARHM